MTGYGRAEQTIGDKTFLVEVRSLNGKQFDLRINIPALLKPFEFDIRNMLNEGLQRGSVECFITIKQNGTGKPVSINTDLAKAYYEPVAALAKELGLPEGDLLSTLLKLPEVITASSETLSDSDWEGFQKVLKEAIYQLNEHRKNEGLSLEADLLLRVSNIEKHQEALTVLAPKRRIKIKEGLVKLLEEQVGKDNYDGNRLEQELIYYIEKIDTVLTSDPF
jgi:uncharacterized protein (TIGR00255 family)